ncbi:MAG: hypothetical protein AB1468_03005 [Candidatus Micrarchaeota archaeon]
MQKQFTPLAEKRIPEKVRSKEMFPVILDKLPHGGGKGGYGTYFEYISAIVNDAFKGAPKIDETRPELTFGAGGTMRIKHKIVSGRVRRMKHETIETKFKKDEINMRKIYRKYGDVESQISAEAQIIQNEETRKKKTEDLLDRCRELNMKFVEIQREDVNFEKLKQETIEIAHEISNRAHILDKLARYKLEEAVELIEKNKISAARTKFVSFENRLQKRIEWIDGSIDKAKKGLRYLSALWQKECESHYSVITTIKKVGSIIERAQSGPKGFTQQHAWGRAKELRDSARYLFCARDEAYEARRLMRQAADDLGDGLTKEGVEKLNAALEKLIEMRIKVEDRAKERHAEKLGLAV